MAKDFVKLSEVPVLEEVTENATALVEEDGEIYRVPKSQIGGSKGMIVKLTAYMDQPS